jgi:hypothetical protein
MNDPADSHTDTTNTSAKAQQGLAGDLAAERTDEPGNLSNDDRRGPTGPGCLPAIMAATLLLGIVLFVTFGFSAWLIFQKRGDLAVRTLRATVIPKLEQSRLAPDEKQAVIAELSGLADDIEQGLYENWQAGGVMQRLITSPLMRWDDLQTVQRWAAANLPDEQAQQAELQISRFFRAIELDRVVARDMHDVLAPVSGPADSLGFVQVKNELQPEEVLEVVQRAKLVADRAEVPEQNFDPIALPDYVRRQIEVGRRDGAD